MPKKVQGEDEDGEDSGEKTGLTVDERRNLSIGGEYEGLTEGQVDALMGRKKVRHAEPIEFTRTVGKDFLDTESRNAVASPLEAVVELVANGWDADAQRVDIKYEPGKTLEVSDDGRGMSPEEAAGFYRAGDSVKRNVQTTEKGRGLLGSFGKAAMGVRSLGVKCTITTKRNGVETIAIERLDKMFVGKRVPGFKREVPKEEHGTTIKVEGLLPENKGGFSVSELYQHLASSIPPAPETEFAVFLNDRLVKQRAIEGATKFIVDEEAPALGRIKGTIYFCGRAVREAGVYVRVNQRRIGDPKRVVTGHDVSQHVLNRIIASIAADGLQNFIKSDRSGFHPCEAYRELQAILTRHFLEVRRYSEYRLENRRGKILEGQHRQALQDIEKEARALEIPEFSQGYHLMMSKELGQHVPGEVDEKSKGIYLNLRHPLLNPDIVLNTKGLRWAIKQLLIETLAVNRVSINRAEEFWRHKSDLYALLKERRRVASKQGIFPSLLYGLSDLTQLGNFSLPSLRYMADRGLLPSTPEREVLGRDFLRVSEEVNPLIPFPDFLKKEFRELEGTNLKSRYEERVKSFGHHSYPFFVNLAADGNFCYFVEPLTKKEAAFLIRSADRRTKVAPSRLARELFDSYFSMKHISEKLNLTLEETQEVVRYADSHGRKISRARRAGHVYQLGGFICAYQQRRLEQKKQEQTPLIKI